MTAVFADAFAILVPTVLMASRPFRALETNLAWSRRKSFSYLVLRLGLGAKGSCGRDNLAGFYENPRLPGITTWKVGVPCSGWAQPS